jgi:peroxiredoxin
MNRIGGALLAAALLIGIASATAPMPTLKQGAEALNDFTGEGHWLVVMLWASDCHLCNREVGDYNDFHQRQGMQGARVLGVSLDGAEKRREAEAFVQRHQLVFPSLLGEPEQVMELYSELTGASWLGTPSFLIYGPDGNLRAAQAGAVPVNLVESYIAEQDAR